MIINGTWNQKQHASQHYSGGGKMVISCCIVMCKFFYILKKKIIALLEDDNVLLQKRRELNSGVLGNQVGHYLPTSRHTTKIHHRYFYL